MNLDSSSIHLWFFILDPAGMRIDSLESGLTQEERARASNYHSELHSLNFMTRRSLLRALLARYLALEAEEIDLIESPLGKPSLSAVHASPDLHFNTSQAAGYLLIGIRRRGPIGVDLVVDDFQDAEALADRILSPDEHQAWSQKPAQERRDILRVAWARKEALLKVSGFGLQIEPAEVRIGRYQEPGSLIVAVPIEGQAIKDWTILDLRHEADWVAAVCVPGAGKLSTTLPEWQPMPRLAPVFEGVRGFHLPLLWEQRSC